MSTSILSRAWRARLVSGLGLLGLAIAHPAAVAAARPIARPGAERLATRPAALAVLPEDGRKIYLDSFAAAEREIRIEICVLEDPEILAGLRAALDRGVRVRAIVDRGKYASLASERENLERYLVAPGGELHLSNPIFPRSFPKVILVDSALVVYGSACLDQLTFAQYRDFAHASTRGDLVAELGRLFENDWQYSAPVGEEPPPFNPTPPISPRSSLVVAPVNAVTRLVEHTQRARRTLDVYSELLGNPTLESEIAAAVERGVRVRLITPLEVNGATAVEQEQHLASLRALEGVGVEVRVSVPPETAERPYMHARAAIADGAAAYLGSVSLSFDASAFNREVGVLLTDERVPRRLRQQFEEDFASRTLPPPP
jgi:phosphatidylserine/phosphatidylglycerophosphate/cardiolipin synthase-like enzyme